MDRMGQKAGGERLHEAYLGDDASGGGSGEHTEAPKIGGRNGGGGCLRRTPFLESYLFDKYTSVNKVSIPFSPHKLQVR